MSTLVSNVKVRVILRDWLICEITRAASEYKNNTKGGVEEKNYYLKFKSERDFLPVSFFSSFLSPSNQSQLTKLISSYVLLQLCF